MNSIQQQIKGYLNNLAPTGTTNVPNIVANIVPPAVDDAAEHPLVYVWGGQLKESRQTMAGGRSTTINTTSGFRDLIWKIDIYIKYAMNNDDPNISTNMPLIVDSIMQKLRGVTMPIQITDPQTSWPSTITEIGEEFIIDKNDVYTLSDQRMYMLETHIVVTVKECLQQ